METIETELEARDKLCSDVSVLIKERNERHFDHDNEKLCLVFKNALESFECLIIALNEHSSECSEYSRVIEVAVSRLNEFVSKYRQPNAKDQPAGALPDRKA
jgi:hypothetical protein